jgi:CO/xanthine dehydrogenase FAD-binding subunit
MERGLRRDLSRRHGHRAVRTRCQGARARADGRERSIVITDFHRLPGDTPQRDNNLEHGELIVAIELPVSAGDSRATRIT